MNKRLHDELEADGLSLTGREEQYIEALSFPQKQLEGALASADSTDGDVTDIIAKDFVDYPSGDRKVVYEEKVGSYGHFPVAVASFEEHLEGRYDRVVRNKKPSGSYFTLKEPISPRCFLPNKLSSESSTRLEQLYVALTALRKVGQSDHPDKEVYLEIELERRFFYYFFRKQFEPTTPHIKVQEFSYTPVPGKFQFGVEYIYI